MGFLLMEGHTHHSIEQTKMFDISRVVLGHISSGSQLLASMIGMPAHILSSDVIMYHTTNAPQTTEQLTATLAIYFLAVFAVTSAVDLLVCRPLTYLLAGKGNTRKYSWFLLHALFNTIITLVCLEDGYHALVSPTTMAWGPNGWYGTYPSGLFGAIAIGAFHVHHFVFYPVTKEDVIHHCVNAGAVVIAGVYLPWGRTSSLSNIPMCGIPGGINYFALWLQKTTGAVSADVQKLENRIMNIMLRLPGQILANYIILLGVVGSVSAPPLGAVTSALMIVGAALHSLNALHYADQVVGNYHVSRLKGPGKQHLS